MRKTKKKYYKNNRKCTILFYQIDISYDHLGRAKFSSENSVKLVCRHSSDTFPCFLINMRGLFLLYSGHPWAEFPGCYKKADRAIQEEQACKQCASNDHNLSLYLKVSALLVWCLDFLRDQHFLEVLDERSPFFIELNLVIVIYNSNRNQSLDNNNKNLMFEIIKIGYLLK